MRMSTAALCLFSASMGLKTMVCSRVPSRIFTMWLDVIYGFFCSAVVPLPSGSDSVNPVGCRQREVQREIGRGETQKGLADEDHNVGSQPTSRQ